MQAFPMLHTLIKIHLTSLEPVLGVRYPLQRRYRLKFFQKFSEHVFQSHLE